MDTLKAILGTILAVAVILSVCAISGIGFLIIMGISLVLVCIGVIWAIFCTIREEIRTSDND